MAVRSRTRKPVSRRAAPKAQKWVYLFANKKAEGNAKMRDLLGGKGAGLAEMTNAGLPVPAGFTITKDGKPVAQAPDQNYDAPTPIPAVGPVPLTNYAPGKYVARMKIRDNVAKKDYTKEAEFEVK